MVHIDECFEGKWEVGKALSYVTFGFGSVVCNCIVISAILCDRQLRTRQVFQIISALAVADFVEGFSTFIGGLYRLCIISLGLVENQFTPFQCMLLPHSFLWRWSDFATSFMLLVLSLDRLISILLPIQYVTWGPAYAAFMIFTPYCLSLIASFFAWLYPMSVNARLSMLCMTSYFSPFFYQFSKYSTSAASAFSVFIYIPLLCILRKQMRLMEHTICVTQVDQRRRAQLRMTVTIAFSSCSTLFFDAIPRAVGVYGTITAMNARNVECESLMSHLFHLTKLNSMINLLLYYIRSKAMRASIRRVCGYKDDIITLNRVTTNSAHQKTHIKAKEVMLLWPDMNQE